MPPRVSSPLWHMAECVQARCQTGVKILATELQNVRKKSAPPSSVLQSHSKRYMQYLSCGVCGRLSVEDRQGATGFWRAVPTAPSRCKTRAEVKHGHFQQEIRLSDNAGQLYIGQPQVRERQSATDKSSAQGWTLQNSFAVLGNGACVLPSGHALHARTNGHQCVVQSLPSACPLENQIVVVASSQCFLPSPRRAGSMHGAVPSR